MRIEKEVKEIARASLVIENVQMKIEKEIFDQVEKVLAEAKKYMKR